ncbi:MAG: hypothetical protein C0628_04340 [Sulfurimonas sp.]|nr:MAG: hypothetical protein C0628_04340 [Sulfurimonas sp.]
MQGLGKHLTEEQDCNDATTIQDINAQYSYEDKIGGGLTFRPYGGFMKFVPESFDLELGNYLILEGQSMKSEDMSGDV